RESCPPKLEEKAARVAARNVQLRGFKREHLDRVHTNTLERLKSEAETRTRNLARICEEQEAKFNADYQAVWQPMEAEWKTRIAPIYQAIEAANATADSLFPPWPQLADKW